MIVNIRGTSGSGKSTLVKRFLDEHQHVPLSANYGNWKKPKVVAYHCFEPEHELKELDDNTYKYTTAGTKPTTFVIGRYETQCGGCDAMSYKGSHDDIEKMVRTCRKTGNVIFEGLTISSTLTRWQRISDENPGQFVWAFMMTPVEECYARILARNGGREPKRDSKGLADYQRKYNGCMNHIKQLREKGETVLELTSDDEGYRRLLDVIQ